ALRQKFLGQAYERRQELLLRHLFELGYDPTLVLCLRLSDLLSLVLDQPGTALRTLYLVVWRKVHPDAGEEAIVFATSEGTPVDPHDLKDYLRKIAGARRNAAFNGFICRSLLAERVGNVERPFPRPRDEADGWGR
ncbi:MAG TPA: hypothetical protein VM711_02665, partial [Sphingomicrobium sp.]|nr:hypothetical protein [Sphingomicrobium sp.]